jgi:N-acetylglucosaminyldiphosphoundecaprenol N-acetyl-beta-D-mannosaminyltransferase
VLGIFVDSVTMGQAVAKAEEFILKRRPSLIVTANAEMVMFAESDAELAQILNNAELTVPDGAGVVWAARYKGQKAPERVAGYDLAQCLLELSAREGYKVFLFGAREEVVKAAKEKAETLYPGINIVGFRHGFFTAEEDEIIIEEIKSANPDILFAALGVPKQEKWLAKYLDTINVPLCMGVGGTFDVMAGVMSRAPLWMQKMSLEWLYRLIKQPERIIRMLALPKFVLRVIFSR